MCGYFCSIDAIHILHCTHQSSSFHFDVLTHLLQNTQLQNFLHHIILQGYSSTQSLHCLHWRSSKQGLHYMFAHVHQHLELAGNICLHWYFCTVCTITQYMFALVKKKTEIVLHVCIDAFALFALVMQVVGEVRA